MSKEPEVWSPQKVHEAINNQEVVVIDVRTPQEYMFEHVEGALLAPMAFIKTDCLPSQDGKRIVFHCGSGVRSGKVANECLAAGFDKIAHMDGGFAAWKEAGLPYIGTEMSTGAPKKIDGTAA